MSDEVQQYNLVSRFFHWSVAVLFLALLFVGYFMGAMEPAPLKFQIYDYHKAFGVTVLLLAVSRIVWRIVSNLPKPLSSHKSWEKYLSKAIHIVLYLSVLAMPVSGWVMSSAGGHSVSFFGLFDMPNIVEKNRDLGRLANQIHGVLPLIIIGAIGLHILGALKHHFIDGDTTLKRMGGHVSFGVIGLLVLGSVFYFPASKWVEDFYANKMQAHESVQDTVNPQE